MTPTEATKANHGDLRDNITYPLENFTQLPDHGKGTASSKVEDAVPLVLIKLSPFKFSTTIELTRGTLGVPSD